MTDPLQSPTMLLLPWCYDCGKEADAACWPLHRVRRRPDPATARQKFARGRRLRPIIAAIVKAARQ